jgi:hypothetical protein
VGALLTLCTLPVYLFLTDPTLEDRIKAWIERYKPSDAPPRAQ